MTGAEQAAQILAAAEAVQRVCRGSTLEAKWSLLRTMGRELRHEAQQIDKLPIGWAPLTPKRRE